MAHSPLTPSSPIRGLLICLILIGTGWTLFNLQAGEVYANPEGSSSISGVAQQITPTPIPTEFSEEVVREGQPTGIIVGAIAIVLLILLGTAPFLLRTRRGGDSD